MRGKHGPAGTGEPPAPEGATGWSRLNSTCFLVAGCAGAGAGSARAREEDIFFVGVCRWYVARVCVVVKRGAWTGVWWRPVFLGGGVGGCIGECLCVCVCVDTCALEYMWK